MVLHKRGIRTTANFFSDSRRDWAAARSTCALHHPPTPLPQLSPCTGTNRGLNHGQALYAAQMSALHKQTLCHANTGMCLPVFGWG